MFILEMAVFGIISGILLGCVFGAGIAILNNKFRRF